MSQLTVSPEISRETCIELTKNVLNNRFIVLRGPSHAVNFFYPHFPGSEREITLKS